MSNLAFALDICARTGVTPKTILGASLLAWYRADLGVSIATGVSSWADQSGTGDANKNAVQADVTKQPTFNAADANYGGRPTISFAGAQVLRTGIWSTPLAQPCTRFLVAHITAESSSTSNYFIDSLADPTQMYILDTGGTSVQSGDPVPGLVVGLTTLNAPSIIVKVDNGASSSLAVRQNTPQATGSGGTFAATGFTMGNYASSGASGGFSMAGPMAEFIVAADALSQSTINKVTAYLATRYGLSQGA